MAAMAASSAILGGLQSQLTISSTKQASGKKLGDSVVLSFPRTKTSLAGQVRCQARNVRDNDGIGSAFGGLQQAVDDATKSEITRDDILGNQERNESEKRSVFGAKPTSGSLYPRPEIERRPETGSKSFWSIFAFDGAAPETINCRLVGFPLSWNSDCSVCCRPALYVL